MKTPKMLLSGSQYSQFRLMLVMSVLLALNTPMVVAGQPLSTRACDPILIEQLPAHVQAPPGELTLFADYADVHDEYLALYLVNRTGQTLAFAAQDGDIYVKPEAQTSRGWERYQDHVSSRCGNSYDYIPVLEPEQYFKFLGYYPKDGEPMDVRYRLFQDTVRMLEAGQHVFMGERMPVLLISNTGKGKVPAGAIEKARYDDLAARRGSNEVTANLALGKTPSSSQTDRRRRFRAVHGLDRFPEERTILLLEQLLEDEDPRISEAALFTLSRLASEVPEAAAIIEALLTDPDPRKRRLAAGARSNFPATEHSIVALEDLLSDEDRLVRHAVIMTLAKFGEKFPPAVAAVEGLLSNPDRETRLFIVYSLSMLPVSDRTVPILSRLVQDNDPDVRKGVVFVLQRVAADAPEAEKLLEQLLDDPDAEVQEGAARYMRVLNRRKKLRTSSASDLNVNASEK